MTFYGGIEIATAIAAAVILFVYALKGFSDDVQRVGGEGLKGLLSALTQNGASGFALGAVVTALLQSSSAVSGIVVALVEAGTISFRGSLPVFLGANVGTTSTAWLVAIDVQILGSALVVLSALISIIPGKIALYGRSIFYLGVVLMALQLISGNVAPLKQVPEVAQWLGYARDPWVGLAIGMVATALLQSSSVVVGVAVIAVQQQLLTTPDVIPIVLGANIGTTTTALLASLGMGVTARRSALVNLIFNVVGVLLFLPFMGPFASLVIAVAGTGDLAVATAHLLFNVGVAIAGFALQGPIARVLLRLS